ncbi:hypothetical protein SO694_00030049 [Aureococcus anophagefferens]|uniref:Dynein regulatory complex subunit 7 n=1 Tax=Aureococcus anophagefferens TaxID=44056 RepID=A0ABR1FJT5_AURAN
MAVTFTSDGRQSTKARRVGALTKDGDGSPPASVPSTYTSDSKKEALCLEYVRHFREKFTALFPDRRELFLMPRNEWGLPKFVCTTLRPTLLPYREIYDFGTLAHFVANYLHYEPLESPNEYPEVLPSPTQVLDWKVGDCFDFAVLLCSYLLGAGYDAYVVYGYAPSWICLRDQSDTTVPILEREAEEAAKAAVAQEAKAKEVGDGAPPTYEAKPRGVPTSRYVAQQEAERKAAEAKAAAANDDDLEADAAAKPRAEAPEPPKQLHAWVMIRGFKRDVQSTVYVEPTTGRAFSPEAAPYRGVEAVWNAKNYWVNMQGTDVPVGDLDFDLVNSDLWEYVFIDPASQAGGSGARAEDDMYTENADGMDGLGGAASLDGDEDDGNLLDIPPSWVAKLAVSRGDFALRYPPDGQRTTLYHKAKLELFAENHHDQGMTVRLLIYKDAARTVVKECRETFLNRRDKLSHRVRFPLEGKLIEEFLPGRVFSLRQLVEYTGRRRELYFYVTARQDGLVCREDDIGHKIIERFEGRPDQLVYRSVSVKQDRVTGSNKPQYTLPGGESAGELIVQKMTQKFVRNAARKADEDVQKRTFYVQEGRIRTQFHYDDLRITRSTRAASGGDARGGGAAAGGGGDGDAESMQLVLAAERDCLTEVRRSQLEMLELLKLRRREETSVVVDRPIFETARERRVEEKTEQAAVESQDAIDRLQVDYLTPFLQNVNDLNAISYEEAQRARDSCLKSLKERLIERANIIMTRLNDENAKLAKKQATFQRNQRDNDPSAEEDFERFCSEAMFRIQILEQRLASHEETALKKFQDLDEKLCADPRLRILQE